MNLRVSVGDGKAGRKGAGEAGEQIQDLLVGGMWGWAKEMTSA